MSRAVSHIQTGLAKKRMYRGEEDAESLIRWLNECEDKLAQRRIRKLLNSVVRMMAAAAVMPTTVEIEDGDEWGRHPKVRSFEAHERHVNKLLKPYRSVPTVMAWRNPDGRRGVDWRFSHRPIDRWSHVSGGLSEFGAVVSIFRLGPFGVTHLRQCNCGKLYFMRFGHQRFCSEGCRIRYYSKDPKWKAYRADKARDYYWLHKNKNVK